MSNQIESLPFDPAHALLIDLRAHEKEVLALDKIEGLASLDQAAVVTLICDGRILAIAGFAELWEGVIEVLIIPSIYVPRYRKSFFIQIKRYLTRLEEDLPIHRMQTASLADAATDRWMQALGFVNEGTLVRYTRTQQNYRMWARYCNGV